MPNNVQVEARGMNPVSMQNALAVTSSTALTVPASATHAIIENTGSASIRYTVDSTVPTSSLGHVLAAGGSLTWTNPDLNYRSWLTGLKAIQTAATGLLEITYFNLKALP